MLRMFAIVFFGPTNPRWSSLRDITPLETVSGGLLIASIVVMGLWWAPFTERISATVTTIPGVT
jgi:NADH:ubiquinone oxidoreductase subunit 4 (subunit M)